LRELPPRSPTSCTRFGRTSLWRKSFSQWRQAASSAGLGGSLQGMVSIRRTVPRGKLWRKRT
jgi:hypothetical protein